MHLHFSNHGEGRKEEGIPLSFLEKSQGRGGDRLSGKRKGGLPISFYPGRRKKKVQRSVKFLHLMVREDKGKGKKKRLTLSPHSSEEKREEGRSAHWPIPGRWDGEGRDVEKKKKEEKRNASVVYLWRAGKGRERKRTDKVSAHLSQKKKKKKGKTWEKKRDRLNCSQRKGEKKGKLDLAPPRLPKKMRTESTKKKGGGKGRDNPHLQGEKKKNGLSPNGPYLDQ